MKPKQHHNRYKVQKELFMAIFNRALADFQPSYLVRDSVRFESDVLYIGTKEYIVK